MAPVEKVATTALRGVTCSCLWQAAKGGPSFNQNLNQIGEESQADYTNPFVFGPRPPAYMSLAIHFSASVINTRK